MPTVAGGSQRAASAQKTSPRAEVSPVPRINAYALRRIGSRRWVTTAARSRARVPGRCVVERPSAQAAVLMRT